MSQVLIDRAVLEATLEHAEFVSGAACEADDALRAVLAAPISTPELPIKAYYYEAPNEYGGLNKSVGLEVRKTFIDAPLVLESDALVQIACLEGEIAKRDAELCERTEEVEYALADLNNALAELAAIKAPARNITAAVDAAMIEMANISPPMRRSECERLIRAALYAAPVPEAKAHDVVIPRLGKFKTSEGGRSYVAEFFKTALQRHDFTTYINERLAADFACALADGLYQLNAAPAAPSADAGVTTHD